jgi:hypothetical protein
MSQVYQRDGVPLTTQGPVASYPPPPVAVRRVGSLVGEVVPLVLPDGVVVGGQDEVGPSVLLVVDEVDVVLVVDVLDIEGALVHVVLVEVDDVEVGPLVVLVVEDGEDVGDPVELEELVADVGVPVELDDVEVVLVPGLEVVDVVGRAVVVLEVGWLVSAVGIPGAVTVVHGWCGDPAGTVEVLSRTDCVPSR